MVDRGCWCENGGRCSTSGLCICPEGFKGSTCQLSEDVSDNAVSKSLEIIIVVAVIIFFMINGLCWLFIWYKRKQQLDDEGISLDALSRLVSVHANRQMSIDQHTLAMSAIDIPPNYEEYLNPERLERSQSALGTPVILPGYLLSHVRHDLKDKRSYSLPNTTIFVPGYYQPNTEKKDGDQADRSGFSTPSTPVILPGYSTPDSAAFSSPSTPVIFPGYMSPVKLSETRRNSSQSSSGSPNINANGVLSPLARFWKKTSPGNKSMDHSSPGNKSMDHSSPGGSPVLPVTISPLVTSEVKVDKAQHPCGTPTHYNYITTPTKSSRLHKKANVPKLFIPPHGASCSVVGVDRCETAPASTGKSHKKSRAKKLLKRTEHVDESKDDPVPMNSMYESTETKNEPEESNA